MKTLQIDLEFNIGTSIYTPLNEEQHKALYQDNENKKTIKAIYFLANFPEPGGCYIRVGSALIDCALAWKHGRLPCMPPLAIEYNGYVPTTFFNGSKFNLSLIFEIYYEGE